MSVQPGIQPAAFVQTGRALPFTLPVTALTRVVKNIPGGALVGGVAIQNFSHLWVYVGIGSGSVQKGGAGQALVIPPYQAGSTPIVADNVNILVDTGPDGSSATTSPNEFIQGVVQEAPLPFSITPIAGLVIPPVVKAMNVVAAGGGSGVAIWTPAVGKRFRLLAAYLGVSVAVNVTLFDGTVASGTIIGVYTVNTNVTVALPNLNVLSSAVNNPLTAQSSSPANLAGSVHGTEE